MTLEEAWKAMAEDRDLTYRFTEHPDDVLKELGVDTSQITIETVPAGTAPYEEFKQAIVNMETDESTTVCVSAGAFICASVGHTPTEKPKPV
jgi:hypothetical protein